MLGFSLRDEVSTVELYRDGTQLDFVEEVKSFIELTDAALSDPDGNQITETVAPLCSRLIASVMESQESDELPPVMVRQLITIAIMGFLFSEWVANHELEIRVKEEKRTPEELEEFAADLIQNVETKVKSLRETTVDQLAMLMGVEKTALEAVQFLEIPSVIRREVEGQSDGDNG